MTSPHSNIDHALEQGDPTLQVDVTIDGDTKRIAGRRTDVVLAAVKEHVREMAGEYHAALQQEVRLLVARLLSTPSEKAALHKKVRDALACEPLPMRHIFHLLGDAVHTATQEDVDMLTLKGEELLRRADALEWKTEEEGNKGETFVFDEADRYVSVAWELQKRLTAIGVLPDAPAPLDRDRLLECLSSALSEEDSQKLLDAYAVLPAVEGIDDTHVRRLCAAMTSVGLRTLESCDGHGLYLAHIVFTFSPEHEKVLKALHTILDDAPLEEHWNIKVAYTASSDPESLGEERRCYVLEPIDAMGVHSKVGERQDSVIRDLDVIGVGLLMYMEHQSQGIPGQRPS